MDMLTTSVLLVAAVGLAAFCNWHQRRPRELGEVSLLPSTPLMAIAVVVAVVAAAHMISLVTGTPFRGRAG